MANARFRHALLLGASYTFYASAHPPHLALLIGVTIAAYFGALSLGGRHKTLRILIVVTIILLPLVVFKYGSFSINLLNQATGNSYDFLELVLPIGISFYVFQAISYVVDVSRGEIEPRKNFCDVALYLSFFPQVLAGPIERPKDLMPQLAKLPKPTASSCYIGLKIIVWGIFCKVVVADNIALIVDTLLNDPTQQSGLSLALGLTLFSFQIYFDFLGYTTIAIGAAKIFGVDLSRNFNCPYLARSIRDFWRRWHITLSTWFRDYVYVPLGGKNTLYPRRVFLIFAVFGLSGLWHGAALAFIAWGLYHGIVYLVEDLLRNKLSPQRQIIQRFHRIILPIQIVGTFLIITIGWSLFRIQDPSNLTTTLTHIFVPGSHSNYFELNEIFNSAHTKVVLLILCISLMFDAKQIVICTANIIPKTKSQIAKEIALANYLLILIFLLGGHSARDFIYYRF